MRVVRLPRGPTLAFKVEKFSLSGHVRKTQKRPVQEKANFQTPPLVVLNNFAPNETGGPNKQQLALVTATFQNMFPAINVQVCRERLTFHRKCYSTFAHRLLSCPSAAESYWCITSARRTLLSCGTMPSGEVCLLFVYADMGLAWLKCG